ncbi:MAG: transposase [Trichodesmium sp. MO_231.B1]|nr:transposase [Trichodesmium sp. MO_231.B1]
MLNAPVDVHLFLEVDPTFAPSVIIKRVKGRASHHLRKEFPRLLKLPTLWTQALFLRHNRKCFNRDY